MTVGQEIQPLAIGAPGRTVTVRSIACHKGYFSSDRIVKLNSRVKVFNIASISEPLVIRRPGKVEIIKPLRGFNDGCFFAGEIINPKALILIRECKLFTIWRGRAFVTKDFGVCCELSPFTAAIYSETPELLLPRLIRE